MKYLKFKYKKLLVLLVLSGISISSANAWGINKKYGDKDVIIKTECISGYLFALAISQGPFNDSGSITMVQVFRGGKWESSTLKAIKCK